MANITPQECPRVYRRIDEHTKQPVISVHRCKDYRNCDNCFSVRLDRYLTPLKAIQNNEPLFIMTVPYEEEKTWARRLDSDYYLRFPVGESVFIFTGDAISKEKIERYGGDYSELEGDGLDVLLATLIDNDESKRISGKLVQSMSLDDDEEYDGTVRYAVCDTTDVDPDIVREAEIEAQAKTADWQPSNVEELETALKKYQRIFQDALASRRARVELRPMARKIKESRINWPNLTLDLGSIYNNTTNSIHIEAKSRLESGVYEVEPFYATKVDEGVAIWRKITGKA